MKKAILEHLYINPFFFVYTAKGIKSGSLSLLYSYKFKSFENYLIPLKYWNGNKEEILSRTGLTEFAEWKKVKEKLKNNMDRQIHKTNNSIHTGKNKYVSFKANSVSTNLKLGISNTV